MTGSHLPNVHAYCSRVGTNRVTAISALTSVLRNAGPCPTIVASSKRHGRHAFASLRRVSQAAGMGEQTFDDRAAAAP
jgi:hypothetical protein